MRVRDYIGVATIKDSLDWPDLLPDLEVHSRVVQRTPPLEDCFYCVALYLPKHSQAVGWVDFPDGAVYVTREREA